jgi:2,4-dienoyl-CoA reductase-like NADH-dependent reductase (Old Yellow Enzyme family)/thioredoxin reductase
LDRLLLPFEARGLRFKNRMIHVPTTMNMSDPQGHVTDRIVGVYETLAAGGSAATVVGATCVRWDGLINERMLGIYDDTYVIGFRDVVDVIKNNDSLAGIQLFYGGMIPGLGSTVPLADATGWIPNTKAWGPSINVVVGHPRPAVMPTDVYDSIVEDFGQSARRAREAGFDFVSLHFCHGSLPHTNLSLLANVGRTDRYADRFMLCELILERIQQLCGKDFPIIPRICCDENLQGGYDIDYFVEHYAPRLHALGIAVLDCTFGSMVAAPSRHPELHSTEFIGPGFYSPHAINLDNIRRLRAKLIERNLDMPLIGSANLGTAEHLRGMIAPGFADFAGVCRLSMDDPEYANKIVEGRENELRLSTRTGASLLQGNIFGKGWAGSAQNPSFGRDREYRITRAQRPRKVVVVGGGSGGMEYAITAKQRGHEVVLFERSSQLGGVMDWAGNYAKVPNMEMIRYQPNYHRAMIAKEGVDCRLGCAATIELILREKPDVVVIATGARFAIPDVPGMRAALESGFAVTIERAMSRTSAFDPGRWPIIYGAGLGGELAVDYAMRGIGVRLLDPAAVYRPANFLGSRAPRVEALMALERVRVELDTMLVDVGTEDIGLDTKGARRRAECDRLILALDRSPAADLVDPLRGRKIQVHVVGDAREPRSYGNAIHEAAYLARQI